MYLVNLFLVLYYKLFGENYDHFIRYKYEIIKDYYGKHCLDIGAGYGHFSNYLHLQGHKITGIDVTNKFQYSLDFQLFNGKKIPLEDKSFDTSIIMFVLHHTNNQIGLLKEASRVTRDYIIIAEDVMSTGLDRVFGNIHLNTSPWEKSNNLFHSTNEWEKIFEDLDLELIKTISIPRNIYPIYPVNRKVYVLATPSDSPQGR